MASLAIPPPDPVVIGYTVLETETKPLDGEIYSAKLKLIADGSNSWIPHGKLLAELDLGVTPLSVICKTYPFREYESLKGSKETMLTLNDVHSYVTRGAGFGTRLVHAAAQIAARRGVPYVGAVSSIVEDFYQKAGMVHGIPDFLLFGETSGVLRASGAT